MSGYKQVDEEDWETVEMLEDAKFQGERRFLVYDCEQRDWSFLGRGHAPLHLVRHSPPPEFEPLIPSLLREAKALVMYRVLRVTRSAHKKLLDWALGWES